MSRKFLIPIVAAAFLAAPAFAPAPIAAGLSGSAQATKNLNSSRSNIYRMGGGPGKKAATAKSGKTNPTSGGAKFLNPQPEPPGRGKSTY